MKHLAVIDNSKDFLKKMAYNMIYGRKFKKLNIDKSLSDSLINIRKDSYAKDILNLINKSKNRDEFSTNIIDYLKLKGRNAYANSLLIGNVTGKYNFNSFYYDSVKGLNLDSFTKDNEDLIQDLKSHFVEYIVSNNERKNTFVERIQVGKSLMRDLSQDLNKKEVIKDFDRVLNGENTNDNYTKHEVVSKYLMKTIGVYTKEDIKENFDFVLYDIDRGDKNGIDERRRKYFLHSNLSNNQLRKIEEAKVLKLRLQKINGEVSEQLISRLNNIENNLDENITELEDIYSDYEVLSREDLIEHLYVPQNDVTIIENVSDLKPQLIHQFIRDPKKFRKLEIEKIKEKIIKERLDKNNTEELTEDEKEKMKELINRVDENLNQYKVNYSTDSKGKNIRMHQGLMNTCQTQVIKYQHQYLKEKNLLNLRMLVLLE